MYFRTLSTYLWFTLVALLMCRMATAQQQAIQSRVETEANGDVFLIQEITIQAPLDKVWEAHTTTKGWQAWVAPAAEIDFKIGGTIRTNYRADGKVTDDDSIVIHIVNYVPKRAITLQAELGENFPAVLKDREKQMYNLLTFEKLDEDRTKLVSYGIGYKDSPELQRMMKFFISANEQSYAALIKHLEADAEEANN